MDAWDRSSKNLETTRGVDDMRGLLTSSMIKTATAGGSVVNKIIDMEREGNEGEDRDGSRPSALRSASAPSASDLRRSSAYEHGSANLAPNAASSAMEVTPSRDSGKLSLSDRLANLNWKFSSTASTPLAESDALAEPFDTHIASSSIAALDPSAPGSPEDNRIPTRVSVGATHATGPVSAAQRTTAALPASVSDPFRDSMLAVACGLELTHHYYTHISPTLGSVSGECLAASTTSLPSITIPAFVFPAHTKQAAACRSGDFG